MTWRHVAIIVAAMAVVVVCGLSEKCQPNYDKLIQLATVAVVGAVAHAKDYKVLRKKRPPVKVVRD